MQAPDKRERPDHRLPSGGKSGIEIIVIAGIAVEHGYTVDEFKKTVFPHPTVGEAIHESLYL